MHRLDHLLRLLEHNLNELSNGQLVPGAGEMETIQRLRERQYTLFPTTAAL